jgi:ubiquinone/menaquinone biosynthesis C-methylase UbiE
MDSYTTFASVYDRFMSDIPYDAWCENICGWLEEYNVPANGTLLELGCGTGAMTRRFAQAGYTLIGVDLSEDMLAIATQQLAEKEADSILYIQQDMCELELEEKVDAVISVCDSMNYLTDPMQILQVLERVNLHLAPNGIFLFDVKTDYFYREILGDQVFAEHQDTCSYIWDNYYYEDEQINEYDLTFFVQEDTESQTGLYRKFEETHIQRGYTMEELKDLIAHSPLQLLAAYDAETKETPHDASERIYLIVGRK